MSRKINPVSGTKRRPRKAKQSALNVAVIDFETDPFLFGRIPKPFCCEFYSDDDETAVFWGDDCADQLLAFLRDHPQRFLIYAHNGGKFDFHFILKDVENPALIIKNRIVKAKLYHHEIRDSFAILPIPLRDYEKMEFDYALMEKPVREKNKALILEYLHVDCIKLFELVSAFIERFGRRMTIGGTAIRELQRLHPFNNLGSRHDAFFRPYYFGGRVQAFEGGILEGPWKMVDVNSMYPAVMKSKRHPINGSFDISRRLPSGPYGVIWEMPFFVHFTGYSDGALPVKKDDGTLDFPRGEGEFFACSHELEIGLRYGLVRIDQIHLCAVANEAIAFEEYVDTNYADKSACKASGDKPGEIFAKLLLNSGYGRTGINPENFGDWIIHKAFGEEYDLIDDGYSLQCEYDDFELWSRPTAPKEESYCDVSIAASITSAARAVLLEGLQLATRPIYCDTDCIICEDFHGDIDPYRLGAWDLEKEAQFACIAGKKLYALANALDAEKPVKISSKGGTLSLAEIVRICRGETVHYQNYAPTFSLRRAINELEPEKAFVQRNFRMTLENAEFEE